MNLGFSVCSEFAVSLYTGSMTLHKMKRFDTSSASSLAASFYYLVFDICEELPSNNRL